MTDRKRKAKAEADVPQPLPEPETADLDLLEADRIRAETRKLQGEHERLQQIIAHDRLIHRRDLATAGEHRILTFYGEVGPTSVARALEELGLWARRDPGEPIKLIFNSPGGSVLDGLALFDYIRELQTSDHQITTVGMGMAASMGGILLQAGQKRVMGRNAYLLIHEVGGFSLGRLSEMEDEVAFAKRVQERLLDILAERSTLTKAQIRRNWRRKDWWLDADQALAAGFVDEVR
jgi:ATP-dependent Clp protease, protease subunit